MPSFSEIKRSLEFCAPEAVYDFVVELCESLQEQFVGTKHEDVLIQLIAIRADSLQSLTTSIHKIVPDIKITYSNCSKGVDRSKYITIADYAIRLT